MKRYKPGLTNTATPWPNLDVKILEASMIECEDGGYIKYLPLHEAAPKMYAMLESLDVYDGSKGSAILQKQINDLLAEARGE